MNEIEAKILTEIYREFETGDQEKALQELRILSKNVGDPWEKTALFYHQTLFLVEMNQLAEARRQLDNFEREFALLAAASPDGYRDGLSQNLDVMGRYAEMRVLMAEKNERRALEVIENLVARYREDPLVQGFGDILDEIQVRRGFLLANAGRWAEARPYLENAPPGEAWGELLVYYLGHCYYELDDYEAARKKLLETVDSAIGEPWLSKAHYMLGVIGYQLVDLPAAKKHFEIYAKTATEESLANTKIWDWLEKTCRLLRHYDEAEEYRQKRDERKNSPVR